MRPFIHTFTGRDINPFEMKLSDIDILDIAHGLACSNRFNGQVKRPISIAQHSVYVARLCSDSPYELQGLLHDGAEAFVGDVVKWIKATPEFITFRGIEDSIQKLIFKKFNCPLKLGRSVELSDRIMVRFEGKKGFGNSFKIDHPDYPELTVDELTRIGKWGFWTWRQAEESFLDHFRMLMYDYNISKTTRINNW